MVPTRIRVLPLLVSAAFLAAALTLGVMERPTLDADSFAMRIERHFQKEEAEVRTLLEGNLLSDLAKKIPVAKSSGNLPIFQKPYTIAVFQNDSLVFWNNVSIGNRIGSRDPFVVGEHERLLRLPNGVYYYTQNDVESIGRVMVYYPIKYEYKLETTYLLNTFAADKNATARKWYNKIPTAKLEVAPPGRGSPVRNLSGKEIFSIVPISPVQRPWVPYVLSSLYLIAAVFGIQWLSSISKSFARNHSPLTGVLLLGGSLAVSRSLMIHFGFTEMFNTIPLFSECYTTHFSSGTIGDILINTLLSLEIALFFFKEFDIRNVERFSHNRRLMISTALYILIISGILGIAYVLRSLVLDTDIPFDFDRIGDLSWQSLVSITSILLMMLMLYLFTCRISLILRQFELPLQERLSTLGIGVLLCFSFAFYLGVDATTLVLLLLFSIIYVISFDIYVENESSNLLWIVAWLVIYSAFSSSFLYKYNQMKEWDQHIDYAAFLTNDRDEVMERKLNQLNREIKGDGQITESLSGIADYGEVNDLLLRNHSIDLRFVEYKYQMHLFRSDRTGGFQSFMPDGAGLDSLFSDRLGTSLPQLRFVQTKSGLGTYYLYIHYPADLARQDIVLLMEFDRDVGEHPKVSTEVFDNEEHQRHQGLSKYEYAVYRKGRLVYKKDGNYPKTTEEIEGLPEPGNFRFEKEDGLSRLLYHARNGNVALMSIELPNFISKLRSLNSYLFTIMVIVLGALMILNTILQVLPFGQEPIFNTLPSLKNKIQVSVISVIILTFLVIGVTTIIFFEQKNDEYHEDRLDSKARSIRGDITREITEKDIRTYNIYEFVDVVQALSHIHLMDINIYDLKGRLVESSGGDLYSKGLVAPLINPAAYYELSVMGKERVTMDKNHKEHIADLSYDTQYEALKNIYGDVIAYVGMPYYAQSSLLEDDTSDFIGTLLNVYVILLVLAGAVAIFVANSITRPLSQIGEKLKEVKIGKTNEPLEWTTKDELGALISEYNKMIKELEDSTQLLAQSERESAWREMAKQVAHEIKNPLTPMKLSIQYLQHAYHANPDNMEPLLQRVSSTLIEQIDNLSHIATAFSNFAKMPRAESEYFEVNQLVQSVFDLFAEQREVDMDLHLPDHPLGVMADKKQLMQVLNNLIKNAMQAIPEERRGNVQVHLSATEDGKIAQVEVRDNGTGIPKDMKEYIFIPHITTKSKGTGLGLAISKQIIESVNGKIHFKTREGIGTSFFVELPIVEGNGTAA